MGKPGPLVCLISYFLITISIIQIEKSIDGVLGIQAGGRKLASADDTTELRRPPMVSYLPHNLLENNA